MFESLVANLLNRFLGAYIEDFDPKQLNIGIWSGDVKLKNLRLKRESLDKFRLPINVKFGHLGELTLQIPWSNLKGKPVKVIIEDVYLLASPIVLNEFDLQEETQREIQVKREKLNHLAIIENANLQNQELSSNISSNESFTESLVTKIVDNLQVTIKNIHIRYEDDSILTENPYSVGLTLKELSAVSTDENWTPSFISITQALTRKLLTLQNLSCYMNTDSVSIYQDDPAKLLEIFQTSAQKLSNDKDDDLQFLLKPVSGQGKLSINKLGATDITPHIKAELFFEEFGIDLDSQQYKDILWTLSQFHWYIKTHKFRKFRPKVSVQEDPKQWLTYAAKSVLNEIHEKNYKWTWDYFAARRDNRIAYIKLYKQKLLNKLTSQSDINELDNLEIELSYEDIKFYRSLTRNELKKENSLIKAKDAALAKSSETSKAEPTSNTSGGWFSGWWGGGSETTETTDKVEDKSEEVSSNDLQLSDDQRKALYEAIDYNENQEIANSIDLPREAVKVEVLATLNKGGLSIRNHKNEADLAQIIFEGCQTQIYQRPDSLLANFQIQEFRVEDGTNNTLYKHIVSVKHYDEFDNADEIEKDDPFFRISFEQNPLDNSADSKLLGKLKSMTIFYNPKFIEEIVKFFKPPKIHLDTVGAIMNAAEATVEGFTSQTRIGLQYALEEHKTINTKLDLQAPLIILPLEPNSWKSPVAILDAGHISVISDLVDKSKIEEVKSKQSYTEADWDQLNTLMYDRFNIHLQDAQFLVGPNVRDTMEQLHFENSEDRHSLILDKLNIKLSLGISILPDVYNLARVKIGGNVPSINLNINDFQYNAMMKIIDAAIPNLDTNDVDDGSVFNAFGNNSEAEIEELTESTTDVKSIETGNKKQVSEAVSSQHMFEFDFKVDVVQISLSRCIDGVTLKAESFVDLIGDSLFMSFYKTANDMHLDLTLDDINLIDHIERSGIPEFERLISSNNFVDNNNTNKTGQLFKLDYSRNQRIVEWNNKEIEVFDQDIKMDVATVKFVITRKSILSILNFVLNTFTDPNSETPADELKHNDSRNDEIAPQKINVDINLDSIICVLNEDGVKLGTLKLSKADISLFLLPESMDIKGKLGALNLYDDMNEGSPEDSDLRNLFSIEGDNLAEFSYKTFDAETNPNIYSSLIEFKTGSSKINFIESSFKRIFSFLGQFQRMKAIYDSTREAAINQASQINDANRIKFDLLISAPTFVFPRMVTHSNLKYDQMVIELGELYATNDFHKDTQGLITNKIQSGLRNINTHSKFNFLNDVFQFANVVENFDLSFDIDYSEDYKEDKPSIVIGGRLPEVDINLTELQLNYLMGLSDVISNVFDISDIDLNDIEEDAANANAVARHKNKELSPMKQEPEEKETPVAPTSNIPDKHPKLVFNFDVPKLALTIYNFTKGVSDIDDCKLACFSLNNLLMDLTMTEDTLFESNLSIKSFVVEDVRKNNESVFREIIPLVNSDNSQFVLSATSEGNAEHKNITLMLTVDNPRVILSVDYLFDLQKFSDTAFAKQLIITELEGLDNDDKTNSETSLAKREEVGDNNKDTTTPTSSTNVGFSINITNPSISLLADPTNKKTEAVVFKIGQVLITRQNLMYLAANSVGMFLCHMDNFQDQRLRIIDDFSVSFAHDSRGSDSTNFLTNIQVSVDPLLLRLSLRDIRLALNIFNRASELYNKSQGKELNDTDDELKFSNEFKKKLSQYVPSITSSVSRNAPKKKADKEPKVIVKGEELNVSIGGMRFVLIGDVHELPVLDMNIKPFDISAINWSTDLSAETHIESFAKVYNYSSSCWEPFVEAWPVAFYVTRAHDLNSGIMIDVVSRELAEVTVTSRTIALFSQISSLITDQAPLKSREETSPYRILNQTGYDIEVWIDQTTDVKKNKTVVKNNEKIPWAFEDWREIRQNLDTDNRRGVLGFRLLDSHYEEITSLSATGEGEEIIMLKPPIKGVHTRIICDISLNENNIKTVWLRSTIQVQNVADIPISIEMCSDADALKVVDEIITPPGESISLPIDYVYSGSIRTKPKIESEYSWSKESLYWKDLLYGGSPLTCNSLATGDKSQYYFQAEAVYDKDEPLSRIYPHMKIIISSPLEVVNLLPFDIDYRLYDRKSRKDWSGSIAKGVKNFIHVASLRSLLLLSVEPKNCGFGKSEFAIINGPNDSGFKRETSMTLKHENGQVLKLKIYYPRKKADNTSLRVVVYAPYLILNRTAQNIVVNEKGNYLQSMGKSSLDKTTPKMFSFDRDNDRGNRALLKVGDSQWSAPLSFEAIGQSTAINIPQSGKLGEMCVGVTVGEGEGVYNLTKVVTIAPRYILKSTLNTSLQMVENGSNNVFTLEPNQLLPLYGLRKTEQKSLLAKFTQGSKTWSSPFTINDIGQIYLKVHKEEVGQVLLKINILTENGSVFIQIENANNNWPFSIRNFSDAEFYIYQGDPNVNEDGELIKRDLQYKPIYYKIPPKSVMPYAYDYPNAIIKELIIRSRGRERPINLSEIGNLKPFRLPPVDNDDQRIVDLNVVADGPTQSLIISNYDPSLSMYKLQKNKTSSASLDHSQQHFEAEEDDENYHTRIITRFEGLGISLINWRYQELLYITLRGLEVRYNESDLYQNLSVKLKWIQIDNQLYGGIFPIILYPSVIPKSGKEMNNHPSFSASVCKVKDDSHGVLFIKYATILLQEMTIEIDEDFLFALLDFSKVPGASWNKKVEDKLCDDYLELPEPKTLSDSSDIYFEALHLQPALLDLSFVRTERVNAEDKATTSQNTLMFFFNVLTMAIGNINDAPIKLNALFIENVRVPIPILMESVQTHYGQSFFYQLHKLLGSADFLGNPVGLFNNLSSGVLDIFYEPYQGFVINDRPQELGIGLAKGGLSFLKKSIFGFSDSFAKVTGSLAKGLSVVTLDQKFQERRRLNQRRNKPKHALYGFASGANSFFDSVSSGVTGMAYAPIEGANNGGGASGFFKGVGKGLVGLPTKTAIGFFDMASNVGEGIRNTTTVFDAEGLDKVRLPRTISYDKVIRPYSAREAQGQFWLKSVDGGVYFNEVYLAHLVLPGEERGIIVTFKNIIHFELNSLRVKWVIQFDQIKGFTMEATGISIGLKRKEGPFIPIPERRARNFIYNRIAIAVEDYNKRCQVEL